jgi:hypothetical protein
MLELVKIIIWPGVVLVMAVLFRKPIIDKIYAMRDLQYHQDDKGKKVSVSFVETSLQETKETLEIIETPNLKLPHLADPKQSILNAWNELESIAERKLAELNINLDKGKFKNTALFYLEYKGALPSTIESAIQNMRMLRNQIVHYPSDAILEKDAHDYVKVIKRIEKTIDAIHSLPGIQLNAVTMIMRNLAHLIDTGKYTNITIEEIHKHIEDETILDFIASLDGASELRGILNSDLWEGFAQFYTKSIKSIYYGYAGNERRKWGIENSGICLLLAWTIEIIQMGSGWYPNEDLSELK